MSSANRKANKRRGTGKGGAASRHSGRGERSQQPSRNAEHGERSSRPERSERGERIPKRSGGVQGSRRIPAAPNPHVLANALCPIAHECGACPHIGIPYDEQLAQKDAYIRDLFADLAGADCEFQPILGMEDPVRFRDKIASPFAPGLNKKPDAHRGKRGAKTGNAPRRDVLCGMYAPGTHRIVPIPECPVEHVAGRKVIAAVRRIMLRYGMEAYDEDAGTGFVRHVVVRVGHETGEVLVTIVTNGDTFPGSKNFCRELVKACPQVTTIVQNVNTRATNAMLGQEERVLYGPGFILDTLCGLSFRISSHSFYQVNATQTEVLYRTAIDMAREGLADSAADRPIALMDAYCGTGTIGLVAASLIPGAQVVGVDNVESAIRDARLNAKHNGIENAEFAAEDAGAYLQRMAAEGARLDVLMMDPPRAGSSEEFLQAALALAPARIVYISCNPATQARDVRMLANGGYRLRRVQPVDMFPHTDHVETVCLLTHS
ncbi:MAG: 23S rRNA (uracil(1939)-C(5))-methyltransferase RlmD [Coriobacteriaceae bacterium]|nr:23S rRNA (uracil(1939)-C(5))-methyltransferase RlmD [Coriobacteriaceae bacterium]